jgi:hypothetical protein
VFNFPFEVEHIVPTTKGGEDIDSNWALACRSCNPRKGVRQTWTDPETNVEIRLYDPRQDKWEENFQLEPDGITILGLTLIGRATVICLNLNSATQLAARRQWTALGVFP